MQKYRPLSLLVRPNTGSIRFTGVPEKPAPEDTPSAQPAPAQNAAQENITPEGHTVAHTGGVVRDDSADAKGALALVDSLSAKLAEEEAQKTKAERRLHARAGVDLTAISAAVELVQRRAGEQSELVKSTFTSVSERVRVRSLLVLRKGNDEAWLQLAKEIDGCLGAMRAMKANPSTVRTLSLEDGMVLVLSHV